MLTPFLSHLLLNICDHTRFLGVCPYSKNLAVVNREPSVTHKLKWLLQGQTNFAESQVLLRSLADGNRLEVMLFSLFWSGNLTHMSVSPHYTRCNLVCEVDLSALGCLF